MDGEYAQFFYFGEAKLFGKFYEETDIPEDPFLIGEIIKRWDATNSHIKSLNPEYDVALTDVEFLFTSHVAMFSDRFLRAVRHAGVGGHDVQYLPMRVFHSNGKEMPPIWLANVLGRVTGALDLEQSQLVSFEPDVIDPITNRPKVSVVGRPVLNKTVVAQFEGDFFRVAEYPDSIFVSDRFVDVYKRGDFTGAFFAQIELV